MDKRTQILIAAETVLAERGFYAFSMQHLADKAEVAIGTIYRYFENKESLMNELQKYIREQSAENLFRGWQESLPCKQKYDLVWQNAFNCVLANPKRLALIEMLHFVPNIDQSEMTLFENETFKKLIDFYQNGIEAKQFLDWQVFALITASLDSSVSLAKQVIRGRVIPEQQQLDQIRDASWAIIQNPNFNQQDLTQ